MYLLKVVYTILIFWCNARKKESNKDTSCFHLSKKIFFTNGSKENYKDTSCFQCTQSCINLTVIIFLDFWLFRLRTEKRNKITRFWFYFVLVSVRWHCEISYQNFLSKNFQYRLIFVVRDLFSGRKLWSSVRSTLLPLS